MQREIGHGEGLNQQYWLRPVIDRLLQRRVTWLADSGPEDDIAISSRIRLARNLRDLPFPLAANPEARNCVRLAP